MSSYRDLLKAVRQALRPHQWVKNLLVAVPLVASHEFSARGVLTSSLILDVCLVFMSFNLCASCTYIINDLCDLEADRLHPTKRLRPFAAGRLAPRFGLALALCCAIAGIGLALLFPNQFYVYAVMYLVTTTAYSLRLKQYAVLDVIILGWLYTLRILGAGCALAITISPWLIAFSMFFFFSLASIKRLTELRDARAQGLPNLPGRGYRDCDLEIVSQCGAAGGYISALVLVLYANDPAVTRLYASPRVLWCAAPLLIFWISRLFLLAHRGELQSDPLVFALKDRTSYVVGLLLALLVFGAMISA